MTNNLDTAPLRLWCGTLFGASLQELLAAATAGGFSSISLFPLVYRNAQKNGLSTEQMRTLAEESGVKVAVIDPLTTWLPQQLRTPPPSTSPEDIAFTHFNVDEVLAMAATFGAESISVIETFGTPIPVDVGIESFAEICDRAAEHGLRVQLEFMPFSGIPDLATAWEIVRGANRSNGGLVFDTWHYFRGQPNNDLLRTIPGDRIFVLQLSDAPLQREESLKEESLHRRLLPGTGSFDLLRLLQIFKEIGATPSIGIEVFSDTLAALPPMEIGRQVGTSLRTFLAQAQLI